MISYAQNFEDAVLARAFAGRKTGFYIDVGAWHPVVDSVTKHFYDLGWRGINVEPLSEYFELLERQRPEDVNLQVAVGSRRGTGTLHCLPGTGLSTLSERHLRDLSEIATERTAKPVEITTLAEICERHVRGEIDFLKIDVEGWEEEVILGADWDRYRPRVLVIEAVEVNVRAFLAAGDGNPGASVRPTPCWHRWEPHLLDHGYAPCLFDGLNRFYVRREDPDLAEVLAAPANVFDRFVLRRVAEAEAERDRAEAEVLDAQRRNQELADRLRKAEEELAALRSQPPP